MKLRLDISGEHYDAVAGELSALGIEIAEDAHYVLTEPDRFADSLTLRDAETNERVRVSAGEIISLEAYGHSVEAHTRRGVFLAGEPLYRLQARLDPGKFLRVSNSVIVARAAIERISPALSMKFTLTLSDKRRVDVTRSYYYSFKEALGI